MHLLTRLRTPIYDASLAWREVSAFNHTQKRQHTRFDTRTQNPSGIPRISVRRTATEVGASRQEEGSN